MKTLILILGGSVDRETRCISLTANQKEKNPVWLSGPSVSLIM